jgi:hypothetical protein
MKDTCGSKYCICYKPAPLVCSKCGKREEHHVDSPSCLMEQVRKLKEDLAYERQAYEALRNKMNRDRAALHNMLRDCF